MTIPRHDDECRELPGGRVWLGSGDRCQWCAAPSIERAATVREGTHLHGSEYGYDAELRVNGTTLLRTAPTETTALAELRKAVIWWELDGYGVPPTAAEVEADAVSVDAAGIPAGPSAGAWDFLTPDTTPELQAGDIVRTAKGYATVRMWSAIYCDHALLTPHGDAHDEWCMQASELTRVDPLTEPLRRWDVIGYVDGPRDGSPEEWVVGDASYIFNRAGLRLIRRPLPDGPA